MPRRVRALAAVLPLLLAACEDPATGWSRDHRAAAWARGGEYASLRACEVAMAAQAAHRRQQGVRFAEATCTRGGRQPE